MSGNKKKPPELSLIQAKADLVAAKSCLSEAEKSTVRLAKYLRGQCGYHLQQACEKMIKVQIYSLLTVVDYGKIYKHDLADLEFYAKAEGIELSLPKYISDRLPLISSWEAEGRYDTHFVVRKDTLKRCISEMDKWYEDLEQNYK
ncbi:MAG TPA: hypothetical protein DCG37_04115 [Lachnospiraceae bacterium]|nr:hypothetical protein [Lachnospiraceae bacterium]